MESLISSEDVDSIEAEAWVDLQLNLSAALKQSLGARVARMSGGVLLLAHNAPALAMNRAMTLGVARPVTEVELDEVIGEYAAAGVKSFVLQWSAKAQPLPMPRWLNERGFSIHSRWSKLYRRADTAAGRAALGPELRIVEIGPEGAEAFDSVVARSLGVPSGLEPSIRSTLGRPNWRFYMVFDGDRPIAGAAAFLRDRHAWLGLGATLDGDRRRGAQTALLARRMADAAEAGCTWVSAETLCETADTPNQSYRNMRRLGFEVLEERQNFLLKLAESPGLSGAAGITD